MIIADLHIHSRYSRACSAQINIENLEKYAKIKGVNLLGTGDFTHPLWYKELKEKLKEESGILKTKNGFDFIWQTEISLICTQGDKGRRVHLVVLAPDSKAVDQIIIYLGKKGRLDYDGRPIFKIPCPKFTEEMKKIDERIEIIPAHIWTPFFSVFGSNSGFNSLKDCFQDQVKNIHAIETGLSSSPAMNWRISELDSKAIVSFSDMHSFWPWRMGREATIFDIEPTYDSLIRAIRNKKIKETIEVDAAYGKYHYDGHRACNIVFSPEESKKHNSICPICKNKLTIGVENRVEELADRPAGFKPENAVPFKSIIPLSELISLTTKKAIATQAVWNEYHKLVDGKSEFDILLNTPLEELKKSVSIELAELIIKNRNGKIKVKPGYDGVYGVPLLPNENSQKSLGEF